MIRRWARKRQQLEATISALLDAGPATGYDLCKASGKRSGAVYPVLTRMLNDGRVTDEWIGDRRYYRTVRP